jgi:acyl-CoA synthetase (NDP forming)
MLGALADDPLVDGLAIQLPPRILNAPREFFHPFAEVLKSQKPIALWLPGVPSGGHESLEWLEDQHVPVFPSPERALKALFALHRSSSMK